MTRKKERRYEKQKAVKTPWQELRAEEKKAALSAEKKLFAKREAMRVSRIKQASRPKFKIIVPPRPKQPTNWQEQEAYDKAMKARKKFIEEQKTQARTRVGDWKAQELEVEIKKALPKKQLREISQGIVRNRLTKQERAEGKIEGKVDKFSSRALAASDYVTNKLSKRIGSRKETKQRARAVGGIIAVMGITGKQTYKGPGRPRGTFKYGMPIQVYKAQMRQKQALYQQYQQEQAARLKPRGFTPEQLQQVQQQQTYSELEQPTQMQVQQQVQRQQVQQVQRPQQMEYQKMRVPTNTKYVQPGPSIADEELNFRKWSAEQTISPNTQRILDTVRRIQNKGKSDNIEQQRRIRERNMVMRSMNLMKAHENMIDTSMDFTGAKPEENILFAPNVFREDMNNNILRSNRPSILSSRETGNNLKFF